MRAVRGIGRIYVRIVIGVVVGEGNFFAVIDVVHGNRRIFRLHARSGAVEHARAHIVLGQKGFLIRRVGQKSLVAGVQPRIEDGDDHAPAVILGGDLLVYFIDTRAPHVGVVGHGAVLGGIVIFGNIHRFYAVHARNTVCIFYVRLDGDGVGEQSISVLVFKGNSFAAERGKKLRLLGQKFIRFALAARGFRVLLQRRAVCFG